MLLLRTFALRPRISTFNGFLIGAGAYRVRALYGRHKLVLTNCNPIDAYRGAGRPEAALIVERLVDEAAREMRIDPIELRRAAPSRPPTSPTPTRTEAAQLLTGSFMDYFMPRADSLPAIRSKMQETLSPTNALGAKGAGETGSSGGLAAIANAVADALRRSGVRDFQMPASPGRVWQALRKETS